jgi:hypothetical protein
VRPPRGRVEIAPSGLIDAWRQTPLDECPYVLAADAAILRSCPASISECGTFEEFVNSDDVGRLEDTRFQLGLLPMPYAGDLQRASVFLLTLNPGFRPADFVLEALSPDLRRVLLANLRQEELDPEFPFPWLNPALAYHPGFEYWHRRFAPLLKELAKAEAGATWPYRRALARLAQAVCVVQLVPYHSRAFHPLPRGALLHSTELARSFAHTTLSVRAREGSALVVVLRKVPEWGLDLGGNILALPRAAMRSSYLPPAILKLIAERIGATRTAAAP